MMMLYLSQKPKGLSSDEPISPLLNVLSQGGTF